MQSVDKSCTESVAVKGGEIVENIKHIIHEGNVRKVTVKQDGETIAEFPLTIGVIGAAVAPSLAAIGAIAALVTDCTIEIEREAAPTPASTGEPIASAWDQAPGALVGEPAVRR